MRLCWPRYTAIAKKTRNAQTILERKILKETNNVGDWVKYKDKPSEHKLWGREVEGTGLESFSVAALCISSAATS